MDVIMFIDGKSEDDTCPQSDNGRCTKCKSDLEHGYGFAGKYGLGTYSFCPDCFMFFDFTEDK